MNGQKFILTVSNSNVSITLQYDLKGFLRSWKLEGEVTEEQYHWLINRVPVEIADIKKKYASNAKFKIEEIPTDLSFERIWLEYGKKVKKVLAQKKWAKMKKSDRVKALLYIPTYNNDLIKSGVAKAHLLTYLNQEYYNDKD